jgi:Tfp pilus assembly protein PilF
VSLAVLAALLLAAAEPPPAEARELKEAGDRKRAAGDAEGARQAYLAAVAVFGGYAEAHEALGEVLLSGKRFPEAARAFEQAVEVEPSLALGWYNLGYTARRLGDPGRARDAWRRYLALRPEDLDARLGLAESLRALGDREASLEAYQDFVELARPLPDEAGRVQKAREAMAALRAEATAAAPAALAPLPAPAAGPGPGAPPRAPPVIIVPVPAEIPGPPPASQGAPRSGRQAAALQKLRLGDRLLAEGDVRLAFYAFQDAVNQDPQSAEARLKLGRVYLRLEHLEEALEQFSVAAALEPGDAEVRRALEEARARQEGRAPPPGSPVIVRLPAGSGSEPAAEPPPAAAPPAPSP